jgi:hypothetical protein
MSNHHNESCNHYVSSRGLLKSCDYHSETPMSCDRHMRGMPNFLRFKKGVHEKLKDDDSYVPSMYICGASIPVFIAHFVKHIDFRFVLVTGDSDVDVPYQAFPNHQALVQLLENKYLAKWFCQNWVGNAHPKVKNLPIGLDYHTLMSSNIFWGPISSAFEQERQLCEIKSHFKPFYERPLKCYSNHHFALKTKYAADRKESIRDVPRNLVYYEEKQIPRLETWRRHNDFCFVISPHGNGYDCHRLWEALILGSIPIVKTSRLDPLYEGLPVLIVREWKDVTAELLKRTVDDFKTRDFQYEKLTLKYWTDQFKLGGRVNRH